MNPYPWLPDWYYELYAGTIAAFDQWVSDVMRVATEKGFSIAIVERTKPQIGSAGTVTFRISCEVLNFSDTRLFDDRVALSFEGDILRFMRYWIQSTACVKYANRLGWEENPGIIRHRAGRFVDRLKARAVSDSMEILL